MILIRKGEKGASVADDVDAIVQTVREPLLVLDGELRVKLASSSFYRHFHVTSDQTEGRLIYELGNGQWNIPALKKLLDELLPQNHHFDDFSVEHDFPGIGRRIMLLNAPRLVSDGGKTQLILLAIEDVTGRPGDGASRDEASCDSPAPADGGRTCLTAMASRDRKGSHSRE